tara:strand:+ start:1811 stop:2914 length:1104 start_codon:yes stop_codon:yes gene_type:complete
MKKRFFPFLIALSALSVSASAAFYSVFGLSKLFAGASYEVMVMAASLEFAKLVVASLLYQYWYTINKFLRVYLSLAVFVLIVITSGGIYGFLSGAYQETATKSELLDKGLKVLELKQTRFEEQKGDLSIEKEQLNKSISDLRLSLSNPAQVQYVDRTSGQLITTTSSSARRALQKELEKTIIDRDSLNIKLETVQDSIIKFDREILNLEISNEDQRELGPLKYLSEVTGKPMNKVVNWFLLLIIFVFDPLAIAMVIAANFAFSRIRKEKETPSPHYTPQPIVPKEVIMQELNEKEVNEEELENKIKDLSTRVGKEEKHLQPIKPNPEDLKKLEDALGLNKTDTQKSNNKEDKKKVLKYVKRGGNQIE